MGFSLHPQLPPSFKLSYLKLTTCCCRILLLLALLSTVAMESHRLQATTLFVWRDILRSFALFTCPCYFWFAYKEECHGQSGLPSRNATNIFNNYSIKKELYSLDQFAEAVVFDAAAQTGTVGWLILIIFCLLLWLVAISVPNDN